MSGKGDLDEYGHAQTGSNFSCDFAFVAVFRGDGDGANGIGIVFNRADLRSTLVSCFQK